MEGSSRTEAEYISIMKALPFIVKIRAHDPTAISTSPNIKIMLRETERETKCGAF
jgi:hypothetical protein